MVKKQDPYTLFLTLSTLRALFFSAAFATSGIYRYQMAELSPLQLVLTGTALELSVFLFEIPTGIVADLYSRRLSVIIGFLLIGSGVFLEGAFTLFTTILLAQVLWGLGYTFTSGALDAWLADEIGEERLEQAYLRSSQFGRAAGFVGIFLGTWLASLRLNIPFLVGGVGLALVALYLFLFMPETAFTPTPRGERTTWQSMFHTFGEGMAFIRRNSTLRIILAITLIYGLSSEGLDRLWEAHMVGSFNVPTLGTLDPIYWFAVINGIVTVLSIGLTEVLRRRATQFDRRRVIRTLLILNAVLIVGLLCFGFATTFWIAMVAYIMLSVARSSSHPIFSTWINRGIDPKVRATVLSTVGQMDAIGQVVGGPPVGALATRYGLRSGLIAVGVLLSPVLLLFRRAYVSEPESD